MTTDTAEPAVTSDQVFRIDLSNDGLVNELALHRVRVATWGRSLRGNANGPHLGRTAYIVFSQLVKELTDTGEVRPAELVQGVPDTAHNREAIRMACNLLGAVDAVEMSPEPPDVVADPELVEFFLKPPSRRFTWRSRA